MQSGDIFSWNKVKPSSLKILTKRIKLQTISDRTFCPENNHRILAFPIFAPTALDAHKFCLNLGTKLFAPSSKEEFDFFWNLTANSQAMTDNCDTGGRKLMHMGIVKLLGSNNESIPHCPYPLENEADHKLRCILGINIYTKQEHSGFNVNTRFDLFDAHYPPLPENSTFLVGKDLSKELEMMNIHTPEDLLENAYRITRSYTKKPYPGMTFYGMFMATLPLTSRWSFQSIFGHVPDWISRTD